MKDAYLIVICNQETNAVEEVTIWSFPEWEQSRCLPEKHVYVLYHIVSVNFSEAKRMLIHIIGKPSSRYHWAYNLLPKEQRCSI